MTGSTLSAHYHTSRETFSKQFGGFLSQPPLPSDYFLKLQDKLVGESRSFSGFLLIDGDWFGRERCLLVYRDAYTGKNLYWRWSTGELGGEIGADLLFLSSHGYPLSGVTSDGRSGIVWAVKEVSRRIGQEIPHQRCLVHVQLSAQRLLTLKPKTEGGRRLLAVVHSLNRIHNHYEKNIWLKWLGRWQERYGEFIKAKTYEDNGHWWYTHRNVRRVYRSLSRDRESLFRYLDVPGLPKDTNGIEGVFGHMDGKTGAHRGMNQTRKEGLISHYLYLQEFPKTTLKTHT